MKMIKVERLSMENNNVNKSVVFHIFTHAHVHLVEKTPRMWT